MIKNICAQIPVLVCLMLSSNYVLAQPPKFEPNYDESKIPAFVLPDVLTMSNGVKCVTAHDWVTKRRPELLRLLSDQEFGFFPPLASGKNDEIKVSYELVESDENALEGKGIRKQIVMTISRGEKSRKVELLIYQPKTSKPVPVFLGLNFKGNHAIHADPAIRISSAVEEEFQRAIAKNPKTVKVERGTAASRWPVELILSRGYAVATIYYYDIDPDFDDKFQNGIHPLFYDQGQSAPKENEWGSIGAWSWGLSRALDYIETDKSLDGKKVAVLGHSRLGKTSLWAGVTDERFAIVISNNSGCGGAALSKRAIGETVGRINTSFPHWFCKNFHHYNLNESALTFDQHELLALVAPRPLYVASATEDKWADPKGEFLSALYAEPVYALFDKPGLGVKEMPAADTPIKSGYIGYHIRTGKHDITAYDWTQYMDFADLHYGK